MGQLKREFNVEGGGRLTMWFNIAPTLIQEHPAGVGFGCLTNDQMRQVFKRVEPNRNHLHANWAQVLVETGWAGLALYLAWMAKMLLNKLAWIRRIPGRTLEERGVAWVAFTLLVGLLLNGLVEYNFGDTELVFIYAFLMGLTGACNSKSESVKCRAL
jgi:O-antigen ligase